MIFIVSKNLQKNLITLFPRAIFLNDFSEVSNLNKLTIQAASLLIYEFQILSDLSKISRIKEKNKLLKVILYYQKGEVLVSTLLNSSINLPFIKTDDHKRLIEFLQVYKQSMQKNGQLVLNQNNRSLEKGIKKIQLSHVEYNLLSLLIERKGRVVERDVLLEEVWSYNSMTNTKTLDVHIYRLRKLLKKEFNLQPIITYPKFGYMYKSN